MENVGTCIHRHLIVQYGINFLLVIYSCCFSTSRRFHTTIMQLLEFQVCAVSALQFTFTYRMHDCSIIHP